MAVDAAKVGVLAVRVAVRLNNPRNDVSVVSAGAAVAAVAAAVAAVAFEVEVSVVEPLQC